MDSMDLEREKGITILAKNTAVRHVADGHADDASTSSTPPATPTSAARSSAGWRWSTASCCSSTPARARCRRPGSCCARRCRSGCRSSWSINKVDRPDARIAEVVDETYELFLDLDADEDQIEFPIVYCQAKAGQASLTRPGDGDDARTTPTSSRCSTTIVRDDPGPGVHRGRAAAGARHQPRRLAVPRPAGAVPGPRGHDQQGPAGRLVPDRRHHRAGQDHRAADDRGARAGARREAGPGDIIAIAGIPEITIGETLADPENPVAAAGHHGRRAVDLDDDRHQHLAAGRAERQEADRPPGQEPARRRARRQRVDPGAADRAAGHLGGPGPRRAAAGRSSSSSCAARASSSPSASRRWSPGRSTARCTSRWSG